MLMPHAQRPIPTFSVHSNIRFTAALTLFGLTASTLPFKAYGQSDDPIPAAALAPEPELIHDTQYPDITKAMFLSYKDINDFIAQSPKATRVAPPNSTDIAAHGPEVIKVIQGADCNRDGRVDDRAQCIKAFYQLWLKFNR